MHRIRGWAQELQLAVWAKPPAERDSPVVPENHTIIDVGRSEENEKVVELPQEGMLASPKPVNEQQEEWQDMSEMTIEGNQMAVKRLDAELGWGQELQFAF